MAFCAKCGQEIVGNFCGACGTAVEAPVTEAPVADVPVAEAPVEAVSTVEPPVADPATEVPTFEQIEAVPEKPAMPKWVIPVAIVAVIAIVAAVLFFALGGSKMGMNDQQLIEARVEAFETAFENGDWNALVACMDSETREMIKGDASMKEVESYFAMIGGMITIDVSVSDIEINGNEASADIEMTMSVLGQEQTESEEMTFVKEGGDWYMSSGTSMLDM